MGVQSDKMNANGAALGGGGGHTQPPPIICSGLEPLSVKMIVLLLHHLLEGLETNESISC